jgi:deazaflavin-dependent oxidoreductase (nitroreductase family)
MSIMETGPARASRRETEGRAPAATRRAPRAIDRVRMSLIRPLTRILNRRILALAGGGGVRAFAVIHHRGRRSGRAYTTPVGARPMADGFVIPLSFGEGADWCVNVLAAGGCVIEWNGAMYALVAPEVVGRAQARSAFGAREWLALRLMGIGRYLRLRHAPTGDEPSRR